MEFEFKTNFHGDLNLEIDGKTINFGYHQNENLAAFLWLYQQQVKQENVFDGVDVWEHEDRFQYIKETIEISLEVVLGLPIKKDKTKQFFHKTYRLATYTAGSNRLTYLFTLQENDLLLSKGVFPFGKDKVELIKQEDTKKLLDAYLLFFREGKEMGVVTDNVATVVKRLKDYKKEDQIPASFFSASALSVRSQVKSGSSLPK